MGLSVFFNNAPSEKPCFIGNLVCFISLCLRDFVFLNATWRDRNCPVFASKGKMWIHAIHQDKASELTIAAGTEVCSLHFQVGRSLVENRLNDGFIQHAFHGLYLSQGKENLLLKVVYICNHFIYPDWLNQAQNKYYSGITKWVNFNCLYHWNQWKHWAKWQQLGAKCTVQFQKISILPPQIEGIGISWGVGGSVRPKHLKKCVKINWNFQRSGGKRCPVQTKLDKIDTLFYDKKW